ncbi:MAG: hypothetical protein EBR79_00545 [Proteobacteria bacterium]|nr:hypothetical protein [Pseudomonadota bacterium]NBX86779.1 hypothetical protein [Pseudomonadota bacterium]
MGRFLILLPLLVFAVLPLPGWASGLFGMIEIQMDRIESIPKWVRALERIRAENMFGLCKRGDCPAKRDAWYAELAEWRGMSAEEQMVRVNRWVNRFDYITDDDNWGMSDYWETPGEFIQRSGDCEDYAILKYYTLRALGWPESALRMVVVHDAVRDIPHAVLAVELEGQNYILDNLATEPLRDEYVRQYTPYYAVNARSRWVFVKPARR